MTGAKFFSLAGCFVLQVCVFFVCLSLEGIVMGEIATNGKREAPSARGLIDERISSG